MINKKAEMPSPVDMVDMAKSGFTATKGMVTWANGLAFGLSAIAGATAGLLASKVTSPSSSIENTGDHVKDLALSQAITARDAAIKAQHVKAIPAKQRHIPFVE